MFIEIKALTIESGIGRAVSMLRMNWQRHWAPYINRNKFGGGLTAADSSCKYPADIVGATRSFSTRLDEFNEQLCNTLGAKFHNQYSQ